MDLSFERRSLGCIITVCGRDEGMLTCLAAALGTHKRRLHKKHVRKQEAGRMKMPHLDKRGKEAKRNEGTYTQDAPHSFAIPGMR